MDVRNEKIFEKLNDNVLTEVAGGLELTKPLPTRVDSGDLSLEDISEKDINENNGGS